MEYFTSGSLNPRQQERFQTTETRESREQYFRTGKGSARE
jgi:hypothetical protein